MSWKGKEGRDESGGKRRKGQIRRAKKEGMNQESRERKDELEEREGMTWQVRKWSL